MIYFQFHVEKLKLEAQKLDMVTTNTSNAIPCEFYFSEEWDGYDKIAVFYIESEKYSVPLKEGKCILPPVEKKFHVGVIGVKGTSFLCSTLIKCEAERGTNLDADDTPQQSIWQQYLAEIIGIKNDVMRTKDDVTALKNETKGYRDESEVSKNSSLESSYQASQHADLAISASEEAETERLLAEQAKTEAQQAKAETDRNRQIVEQYVTNLPTRYFKKSVAEMEAITGAKNGDVCYITNFTDGETAQYIYDTMDIDGDSKNPEWLFLGNLPYLVIDRDTLLGILQLPTVAISGSYPDLTNKPSRYEPFTGLDGTAGTIVWDFSISCNAYVTLSGIKPLQITNISNGAVGVLKVFGADIILPSNSEPVPPDFDYLPLQDGQYWEYVFDYDGVNFSWTRRVKNMAVISNE